MCRHQIPGLLWDLGHFYNWPKYLSPLPGPILGLFGGRAHNHSFTFTYKNSFWTMDQFFYAKLSQYSSREEQCLLGAWHVIMQKYLQMRSRSHIKGFLSLQADTSCAFQHSHHRGELIIVLQSYESLVWYTVSIKHSLSSTDHSNLAQNVKHDKLNQSHYLKWGPHHGLVEDQCKCENTLNCDLCTANAFSEEDLNNLCTYERWLNNIKRGQTIMKF